MTHMVSFSDVSVQIFQPYFFYSLVFLTLTFVCIKIYFKFNPPLPRRIQSIIWLTPLIVPVIVLLCIPPQTLITAKLSPAITAPMGTALIFLQPNITSLAGLMCLVGAVLAVGYFALMMVFGKKIALRHFHVVLMGQDEYVSVQEIVKETARKIGVAEPKVGLVEDLLPNAFTVGYGRSTVLVFSLGLLKILDSEEQTAVISHELAHVKAKDYLFRTLSYTLNALSFFNPLSYFAASHAQRERELLADQNGVALLDKPLLMANVFSKLEAFAPEFPKARLWDRLSASLFLVSPLAHRPAILASHPQMSQRIQNITAATCKPARKHRQMFPAIFLLGILASLALIVGVSTMQIQQTCLQQENTSLINQVKVVMYNSSLPYTPGMGRLFPSIESFEGFNSGQNFFMDAYGNPIAFLRIDQNLPTK